MGRNYQLKPVAYSFTDGVTTRTEESGYDFSEGWSFFDLAEAGEIISYRIIMEFHVVGEAEPFRHVGFGVDSANEWTAYSPEFCNAAPIPAAVWLFGSGRGLLGWFRRKA